METRRQWIEPVERLFGSKGIELTLRASRRRCVRISSLKKIAILGLKPAMRLEVLIHELAHEFLHPDREMRKRLTHAVMETEAQAVAQVVCQALGLEGIEHSADYIHLHNGDSEVLAKSMQRIQKCASGILNDLLDDDESASSLYRIGRRTQIRCPSNIWLPSPKRSGDCGTECKLTPSCGRFSLQLATTLPRHGPRQTSQPTFYLLSFFSKNGINASPGGRSGHRGSCSVSADFVSRNTSTVARLRTIPDRLRDQEIALRPPHLFACDFPLRGRVAHSRLLSEPLDRV